MSKSNESLESRTMNVIARSKSLAEFERFELLHSWSDQPEILSALTTAVEAEKYFQGSFLNTLLKEEWRAAYDLSLSDSFPVQTEETKQRVLSCIAQPFRGTVYTLEEFDRVWNCFEERGPCLEDFLIVAPEARRTQVIEYAITTLKKLLEKFPDIDDWNLFAMCVAVTCAAHEELMLETLNEFISKVKSCHTDEIHGKDPALLCIAASLFMNNLIERDLPVPETLEEVLQGYECPPAF